ncbi:ATP-binding protein [Candidatus Chrysopegis kryptomonas]|jgi:stage II sporulation protein AB (anti-sigma F factor)|uniref:Serine/threonine-protein kinase RsbW n=1 Tax=Candidatus Chryseopegocella kryptomonas TaxID=1633643 RepID=A0A0P1MKC1_9BACT|nr:ATP-binding protein [Candidatus Chrysopegis kryptomonas]CUS95925.1 serine/threonine-protein kinase RsbW [Candidatus Chrysopegis kryptomonas]
MSAREKNKKIKIKSELKNLKLVRDFIRKEAIKFGFDEIDVEKIILSVDEVCTNSIKHSYENKPDGIIYVEVKKSGNRFSVVVSYDGLPFEPEKLKIESPLDKFKRTGKVKRGKLGMFIIHRFMDRVKYQRKRNKNVVILTKFLRKDE